MFEVDTNVALSQYEKMRALLRRDNIVPTTVEINLTSEMYPHCQCQTPSDWNVLPKMFFPKDEAIRIVRDLKNSGVKGFVFNGKYDPCEMDGLADILEHTESQDTSVMVISNGRHLRKNIDAIGRFCDVLVLDLSASTPITYNKLAVQDGDNLEKVLDCIRDVRVRNKKIKIIGRFYPNKVNYKEAGEFIKLCDKYGFVKSIVMHPQGLTDKQKDEMDELSFVAYDEIIDKKYNNKKWLPFVFTDWALKDITDMKREPVLSFTFPLLLSINPKLDVYIAVKEYKDSKYKIGSFRSNTFRNIWDNKENTYKIGKLDLNLCDDCRFKHYETLIKGVVANDSLLHNIL